MKKWLWISVAYAASLGAAVLDEQFDGETLRGKRVGYYLGSFDPLHRGHEHVIEKALEGGLDYVLVYAAPGNDRFKQRTVWEVRQRMLASLYEQSPRVLITAWMPKKLQEFAEKLGAEGREPLLPKSTTEKFIKLLSSL